jgi:hypothetical protein
VASGNEKMVMANRRMFSKSITNSSQFLMMPPSSQNLYFHLGMNADDDGFCEHFGIMRMTESKPDDLKVLQLKGFVRIFDDRVLVIIDWKENNYLRADRYTPSKYLEIYKNDLKELAGRPMVYQMATEVRLGEVRSGELITNKQLVSQLVMWINNQTTSIENPEAWVAALIKKYGDKAVASAFDRMNLTANPSPAKMAKLLKDGHKK